jgi:HEAT repeat protein
MNELKVFIIVAVSAALLLLIAGLFLASIARRVLHARKYRRLDGLRSFYEKKFIADLDAGGTNIAIEEYRAVPGSLEWQAAEDVFFLMMEEERYRDEVRRLFLGLGYVAYYEDRIGSMNAVVKESAVDKLGRMEHEASAAKLLPLLDDTDPGILSVTVRALSKLRSKEGLRKIVEKLPALLGRSLVARKAMETALLNFGPAAVPVLIDQHGEHPEPLVVATVLEILSHFPPETRAVFLAIEHLKDKDPEVRSRSLRVLGNARRNLPEHLPAQILPLLADPVWFVRLQAVKATGLLGCEQAAAPLGRLLFDENWQVRSGAALALTSLGDCAVDVFLEALTLYDVDAKKDVCEEIEKAGFTRRLIENLGSSDTATRTKSREILTLMHTLGFSAPLSEYLNSGVDDQCRKSLQEILASEDAR